MVSVEDIKLSIRLDLTTDDTMIKNYIDTASEYVRSAVDSTATTEELETYPQFDFAVSMLVQFWYTNRGDVDMKQMPFQVVSMIQQMRGKR